MECHYNNCPAGFRVLDAKAAQKRCVERCPRFESGGGASGDAGCVSECSLEQFWQIIDVDGAQIARCVENCAELGGVDVATRQCVRPGVCRFVTFDESGIIQCHLECPADLGLRLPV